MATLKVRVGDELKAATREAAERRGLTESELVRAMLTRLTATEAPAERDDAPAPGREYERRDQQMKLTLTRSEKRAIDERASREGMRSSYWVIWLTRTHLTGQPQFNPNELDALREATRQLAAVGSNLNQVAHALNADLRHRDKLTDELIHQVAREVKSLRREIKAYVETAVNRWGV